ncbi:MAG: UDP-N-acetylmuramoyl-L-alanyl-D-glutamate--2,6-diaminopimelate ligase [Flavobacteriales bacterium Tduv]
MKRLKDILNQTPIKQLIGPEDRKIAGLCQHSEQAGPDMLFAASWGRTVDGHLFIIDAIQKGAKVVLCQKLPETIDESVTYLLVKDTAEALGLISANFYEHPTRSLNLIGVTGTNGKTTVTTLLYELFSKLGEKVAMLSTITTKIADKESPSTYTTPDVISTNRHLSEAVKTGCTYAFMEVSSHGINQKRIAGLNFKGGVFTNITHDHLDYHKTFQNYLSTKKNFFDRLAKEAFALVNIDDKNALVILQNSRAEKRSYALKKPADYKAKILEKSFEGSKLLIDGQEFWTPLIGTFNVYNLLEVYGVATESGKDRREILIAMSSLKAVKGRFQQVSSPTGIRIIIDYAHTPDALKNVLETIREIRKDRKQLICLIGCGGNRDQKKRPIMAQIACEKSDLIILTSDNPRYEDPEKILDEMERGLSVQYRKKILRITERKEAIKTAIALAKAGDIILIAGKGHETYQEIKGIRQKFDEMKIVETFLSILEKQRGK